MTSEAVETIERDGFTAELHYDENPTSPAEWDQLGTLVTWHRRWCPDQDGSKEFGDPQDFLKRAKEDGWVYLPVSLYEHSGMTIWVGSGPHTTDQQGWDSGQVGFIYCTKERFIKAVDTKTHRWRKRSEKILQSEVETWDTYIRGDVYGVVVKGPDGEVLDSCWGYYGHEYAVGEMKTMLEQTVKAEENEKAKINRVVAL